MIKTIFVIVLIIFISGFLVYLNVPSLFNTLLSVLGNISFIVQPLTTIYNIMVSYNDFLTFFMAFLGAYLVRYLFYKLGVYGD